MNKISKCLALSALLFMAFARPAFAHVKYYDLILSGPSITFSTYYNNGWYNGTQPTLADSHLLNGAAFFKFTLTQPADVTITFADTSPTPGALNPAFSLYRGLLPTNGHDLAPFDNNNPTNPVPPFNFIASQVDNGITVDGQGYVSPFRDTAHITFNGQFNALGDWSLATTTAPAWTATNSTPGTSAYNANLAAAVSASPSQWSVIQYITHVSPAGGNSVALTNYYLPAGTYTVAAGGGNAVAAGTNNLSGTISFSQSAPTPTSSVPVPIPSGVLAMLAAALSGLGYFFRKKT
jgi:hypothetical protein